MADGRLQNGRSSIWAQSSLPKAHQFGHEYQEQEYTLFPAHEGVKYPACRNIHGVY